MLTHRCFSCYCRYVLIMENKICLVIIVNILQLYLHFVGSETTVEATTPVYPVTVDGILAFQCQVWNIQNGDTVMIARTLAEGSEQISSGLSIIESPVKDTVYLATRTLTDGSTLYFMTLLDVSLSYSGEYACSVIRIVDTLPTVIGHDSINVQIYLFPDKSHPSCTGNPPNVILKEDTTLELTCTSHKAVPDVDLKWRSLSAYQYLQSSDLSLDDTVVSRLYVRISMEHHGTIFRCEMTSPGFPDRMQSCEIGPFSVQPSSNTVNHGLTLTTRTPKEVTVDGANPPSDCQNVCTSSSITIFYLTVSTGATCVLTFVFFITTILMCCKYYNVSRQRQQYVPTPPSQVLDPVYVSLQRRNTNERVYMTLEDPNNPEGKVLLPKEVFDEFYNRTLSLRKT